MMQKTLLAFALVGSMLTSCNPFAPKYGKSHLRFDHEMRELNKKVTRSPVVYTDKSRPGRISLRYSQPEKNIVTMLNFRDKNFNGIVGLGDITGYTRTETNPETGIKKVTVFDGLKSFTTMKSDTLGVLYQTKNIHGGMDRRDNKDVAKELFGDIGTRFDTPPNALMRSKP